MKAPTPILRGYLTALRKHLEGAPAPNPEAAGVLGARAMKLGLGTPDLAGIHAASLVELVSVNAIGTGEKTIRSAGLFFAKVTAPIENSHRAARKANLKLEAAYGSLNRRASKLAAANAELKREIGLRKTTEARLKAGERDSNRLLKESFREQEALRLFSRQLLSSQEDERKRISRDLHDVVAQALTGINIRLAGINMQTTAGAEQLLGKIASTQKLLEKSMEVVHRFAADLRPSVLDDLGLIPAIRSHLGQFTEDAGIHVGFAATAAVEELDNAARTALYRVVQEALANISRHAEARGATIRIDAHGTFIRLEIADDGKGFRPGAPPPAGSGPRLGLLGMKERVEMVGGTLRIVSAPSAGTSIVAEIPLARLPGSGRSGDTLPERR